MSMKRTSMVRAAAAALAGALVLVGCSEADEVEDVVVPPLAERVSFEDVAMPDELSSTSRSVGSWSTVPESGDLPRIAVTTVRHGRAAEADVGVWQASGESVLAEQAEIAVAGDVASAQVATDGELTAIGGRTVVDGVPQSILFVSTDRTTWEPVELTAEAAAVAATSVAVSSPHVYLLGAGATGRSPRVALVNTTDGTSTVSALPAPADDQEVSLSGLAVAGDRIVAITELGPKGDFAAPQAHVSDDGEQFTTFEIGPDTVDIYGLVLAGDELVATGSLREGGYATPASWSSPDGETWTADVMAPLWEWDPNAWSTAPTDIRFSHATYDPSTGVVSAAVRNDSTGVLAGAVRIDGSWETLAYFGARGVSPSGIALQVGEWTSLLSTYSDGSGAEVRYHRDSDTFEENELVSYDTEPSAVTAIGLGDQVGITAVTSIFISEGNGWRNTTESSFFVYDADDGVTPASWVPDDLPEESLPRFGSNPSGDTHVLMTPRYTDQQFVTNSWLRDGSGTWTPGATIDAATIQLPGVIAGIKGGWLAALQTEHRGSDGHVPRRAEIWESADGLEWTKQEGQFAFPGGQDSIVYDICETPQGPVAVGSMDDPEGKSRATAWHQVDGAWKPAVLADTTSSSMRTCFGTEDGVLLFGSDGDASRSWRSSDLATFTSVDRLDEGLHRATVVEVPGGYAAGGTARTEDYVGPVLWLSADSAEWTWVRLPVSTSSSYAPEVVVAGSDLLVLDQATLQAWRIADIGTILAEEAPEDDAA